MKKKLMMVAVLLGALTLGACVDDNESASVTAIRNAKAAQLESLAALNNAKAAAETVRAEAEAALNNAKAAYQQAKADATAAETEFLTQKYQMQLEKLQAEYAQAIAEAKQNAALADKEAWKETEKHIQNVLKDYTNALDRIHTLNGDLIDKEFELANVEVNDEAAQAVYAQTLAWYNQDIANKTAQIERLKSLNTDKAALETQLNELAQQAYTLVKTDLPAAEDAVEAAEDAYDDAYYPINREYASTLPTPPDQHDIDAWQAAKLDYVKAIDTLMTVQSQVSSIQLVQTVDVDVEAVEGCSVTKKVTTYALTEGSEYLEATQEIDRWFANRIDYQQNTVIGHASDPDATPAVGATGLYRDLEDAQDDKKAADDDLKAEQAKTDPDEALIKQYTEQSQDAQVAILAAQEAIADAQEILAEIQAEQASYKANLAVAAAGTDEEKAYQAAVEKAVEAQEAVLVATHEQHKVEAAIDVIGLEEADFSNAGEVIGTADTGSEYALLKDIYDDAATVETQILALERVIAETKQDIAELGADGYWTTMTTDVWVPSISSWETVDVDIFVATDKATVEQTKALIQMEIDNIKAELEAYEKMADMYKAELEALINASEETPAA